MSNLTRKKVKVRGKNGKVYQRTMNVRSGAPTKRLRSAAPDQDKVANRVLRGGIGSAGLGIGALAGGWRHNATHQILGAVGGTAIGAGIGHALTKARLSNRAKMGIGMAGHAVGFGSVVYNAHRQFAAIRRGPQFPQVSFTFGR